MGDSRPFRRSGCDPLFFFPPFKYVTDEHKKMTYTNVQIFLKISVAAIVEIAMEFGPLSILFKFTP